MSIGLPHTIHENAYDHIRSETIRLEKLAEERGGQYWIDFTKDRDRQTVFLESFRKTFSVRISNQIADVPYRVYSRWRVSSIAFVEDFNNIIEEWHDDMYMSAAARARGHLVADKDTESGYIESAEGVPIFHDADSGLTKVFLKAMHPEQFNEKMSLEMSGGTNDRTTHKLDPAQYAALRNEVLNADDC